MIEITNKEDIANCYKASPFVSIICKMCNISHVIIETKMLYCIVYVAENEKWYVAIKSDILDDSNLTSSFIL